MQTPKNENQHEPIATLTLVAQVEARRVELTRALADSANSPSTRGDIEGALARLPTMLTGDLQKLPDMVSRDLTQWLESSKYLGVHGVAAAQPTAAAEPTPTAEDVNQPAPTPVLPAEVSGRI
ncbi:MAG TPA: hypothetical protein VHE35_15475 [Kofleriaceae bacterium]|nr:hypothetical protein [Kofleriaceae bacterium]